MKKLSAVSYLLILFATLINGHLLGLIKLSERWRIKNQPFKCMSGTVDERTKDDCNTIIKEWVMATNRKNIETSKDSTTIEIASKKSNNDIKIRVKSQSYDQNIRLLFPDSRKNTHGNNSNSFIDQDEERRIYPHNPFNDVNDKYDIYYDVVNKVKSLKSRSLLKKNLYDPELSYNSAKPSDLKELYIPYALEVLDKRIQNNIDYLRILNENNSLILRLLKQSNYPGNTQNLEKVNSIISQLNSNLDKLPKSSNQTLNYHIDNVKIIMNDPTKIQNSLRSIPPALLLVNQKFQSGYQFNTSLWYQFRPYLLDNKWYCAAINASPPLLEEASSSNDDPEQYSNTFSPHKKLSNKTALEVAEEMRDWHCDENNDTFYNSEECDHRHKLVETFKNSVKEWNNQRTKQD